MGKYDWTEEMKEKGGDPKERSIKTLFWVCATLIILSGSWLVLWAEPLSVALSFDDYRKSLT